MFGAEMEKVYPVRAQKAEMDEPLALNIVSIQAGIYICIFDKAINISNNIHIILLDGTFLIFQAVK